MKKQKNHVLFSLLCGSLCLPRPTELDKSILFTQVYSRSGGSVALCVTKNKNLHRGTRRYHRDTQRKSKGDCAISQIPSFLYCK